ncbi:DMT family transporter [Streptomyces sp. NBC_01353]|uniref:DMT family transporter n=1 Tax=Streptomyces sp. NBC_01353 TaxID=2903835 RepID=UPI002E2EEC42|nr:DMT family transporter [Streptomyces sp. NBC_01353]
MTAPDGIVLAVLLSLVSAAGYALAAVAQSRLAASAPSDGGGGALRALLARGQWWWSVGLNAAGALAHVAALHYGPLTLVQPLGALTLVAALPLGAYCARRRVTRAEWRGAFWTLAGLVGLISVTGPATPGDALTLREALIVASSTALLIVILARGGRNSAGSRAETSRRGRGLGHATASGIASGVASALTQTLTAALARELPGGATAWWQTTLIAVLLSAFAVGGLLLSQTAYRGGLAAPLAVVNLSNPAAAAVIGVALLGETFRAGVWGWLIAAAASAVAARGVVLLTTGAGAAPTTPSPAPVPTTPSLAPAPTTQASTTVAALVTAPVTSPLSTVAAPAQPLPPLRTDEPATVPAASPAPTPAPLAG